MLNYVTKNTQFGTRFTKRMSLHKLTVLLGYSIIIEIDVKI